MLFILIIKIENYDLKKFSSNRDLVPFKKSFFFLHVKCVNGIQVHRKILVLFKISWISFMYFTIIIHFIMGTDLSLDVDFLY